MKNSPALLGCLSLLLISGVISQAYARNPIIFEAEGEHWIVQAEETIYYDSRLANTLVVFSLSGEKAYAQPAWIGEDPGDLGPLWVIQNERGEVFAACWWYYGGNRLECMGLAVNGSLTQTNDLTLY